MLGLTEDDLQPPDVEERGERKLVQALLGYVDADAVDAKSEEKEEDMVFESDYTHDGFKKYPRRIIKHDW